MRTTSRVIALWVLHAVLVASLWAQTPAVDEVVANIKSQPIGQHTVGDLNLPDEFLRRLANRVIAEAFENRFRIVVDHAAAGAPEPQVTPSSLPTMRQASEAIAVIDRETPQEKLAWRQSLTERRPPLRNFFASMHTTASSAPPFEAPGQSDNAALQAASQICGTRLAIDGLLATTLQIVHVLADAGVVNQENVDQLLTAVGVPVALLNNFKSPCDDSLTHCLLRELQSSGIEAARSRIAAINQTFQYKPASPAFRVASESGEHDIGMLRMQLTRGDYWEGESDGGNVDVLRQLISAVPDAKVITSIARSHMTGLLKTAQSWPLQRNKQLTIIAEDLPLSQWAQDNAKAGLLVDDSGSHAALIVPRFASRGEDSSILLPGDSFVFDRLRDAGLHIVQSQLLFQGGNLLAIQHPETQERVLLIGEAEIYRNMALGLSREQTLNAFKAEFGVDRCEVLPSVSFHIDYDVSVRNHQGEWIALVNDVEAGAALALECAVDVLEKQELLGGEDAAAMRKEIAGRDWNAIINSLGRDFYHIGGAMGHFPKKFADAFGATPDNNGIGNLQRVLLALDVVAALSIDLEKLPSGTPLRDYLESLRRQNETRQQLHNQLRALGMRLAPIPALPSDRRGINYVNGIHAAGPNGRLYLMPTYGGMFTAMDDAAKAAIAAGWGDGDAQPRIIPILTAESQRRAGAVHCSVMAIPAAANTPDNH